MAGLDISVDGTLLPAVVDDQIFVENRDFIHQLHWTPPLFFLPRDVYA